jgi:hypothetical protein
MQEQYGGKWKKDELPRLKYRRASPEMLFYIKGWVMTLGALALFALAIYGVMENTLGGILRIEKISKANEQFLEKSLVTAMGHFAALSIAKGGLAAVSESAPFGFAVGKTVSSASETIHFIWKLFGYSMVSITGQMAILQFFSLIAIKVIFAAGALVFTLSFNVIGVLRRAGLALMIVGLVLYGLMPCSIYVGKVMFEKNSKATNEKFSEDLEAFKDQVANVEIFTLSNLNPDQTKETISSVGNTLSEGLDVLIHSLVKYFSNLLIMFVLTPLFFYGLIYLLVMKSLNSIGMGRVSVKVDESLIRALRRL